MGPAVNESQRDAVAKYVEIGRGEGARLVLGGHALVDGAYANGYFFEPTIFADVAPSMRIAQEEIFGPVVSVMRCRSFEHAVEIGNDVAYGLSASIYTQDEQGSEPCAISTPGSFFVNAPTIGAEVHLPFGGTKATETAIAKPGPPRSVAFRSGSRSTSISAGDSQRARSTRTSRCASRSCRRRLVSRSRARAVKAVKAAGDVFGQRLEFDMLPWGRNITSRPASRFRLTASRGCGSSTRSSSARWDPRVPDNRHARDILLGTGSRLDLYVNYRPGMACSTPACVR